MKRALLANGVDVDEWHHQDAGDKGATSSMLWLQRHLLEHGPAILVVDESEHWITVLGSVAQTTFIAFDPSRNHGVEVHSWDSLVDRWRDPEDGFYGLGVVLRPGS
jgi:hypothetical protein